MKSKLIFSLVTLCLFSLALNIAFAVPISGWNKLYDAGLDYYSADTLISTNDEGYAIGGSNSSSFFLVKTDSSGNIQWNATYGGTDYVWTNTLIQAPDGGYILAGTLDTLSYSTRANNVITNYYLPDVPFILKVDSSGKILWNVTYVFHQFGDRLCSVLKNVDGGYSLIGYERDVSPTNGAIGWTPKSIWLARTDSSCILQWNRTIVGVNLQAPDFFMQTSDLGYAFGLGENPPESFVRTDAAGNIQWTLTTTGVVDAAVQTNDGGYVIKSRLQGDNFVEYNIITKIDSQGRKQWSKTYEFVPPPSVPSHALIQTADGGLAIAFSGDNADRSWTGLTYLVKTDSLGNMLWNQTYQVGDYPVSLLQTLDGGYTVLVTQTFPTSFWLINTDKNGLAPCTVLKETPSPVIFSSNSPSPSTESPLTSNQSSSPSLSFALTPSEMATPYATPSSEHQTNPLPNEIIYVFAAMVIAVIALGLVIFIRKKKR